MGATDITLIKLAAAYLLLIVPLGAILWLRLSLLGETLLAVVRMTLQLAFVGLYLQVVFRYNLTWLNLLWLLAMVLVADLSIVRGCGLRPRYFIAPMFLALLAGTGVPLLLFTGLLLETRGLLDAQYAIPIGGMILGNCLRADIIGVRGFYASLQKREKAYLQSLACGARLREAIRPFFQEAYRDAIAPTVATMATMGLVSLPGMMTGQVLGGSNPMTAVKYQIAIMIAIFSGTSITVLLGVLMTLRTSFSSYGLLKSEIFAPK